MGPDRGRKIREGSVQIRTSNSTTTSSYGLGLERGSVGTSRGAWKRQGVAGTSCTGHPRRNCHGNEMTEKYAFQRAIFEA